jgi:hypothetical protein
MFSGVNAQVIGTKNRKPIFAYKSPWKSNPQNKIYLNYISLQDQVQFYATS